MKMIDCDKTVLISVNHDVNRCHTWMFLDILGVTDTIVD